MLRNRWLPLAWIGFVALLFSLKGHLCLHQLEQLFEYRETSLASGMMIFLEVEREALLLITCLR